MGEKLDEFEQLFDYSRSQPDYVVIEDDDDDAVPLTILDGPTRKRLLNYDFKNEKEKKSQKIVNTNENDKKVKDDEENWMPLPPPSISKSGERFKDLHEEIRLRKEELASINMDMIETLVESAKKERRTVSESTIIVLDGEEPSKPVRQKILISIQDKDGLKPYRMYMDNKLEKLFKIHADKVKVDVESMVFSFDGEKLSPSATPSSAGLEEGDVIEVHMK